MMIPVDILHAIADWARVAEARVSAVLHYPHNGVGVTVTVDEAAFRRAFAGCTVRVREPGDPHRWAVMYGPDMGGWCAETVIAPRRAVAPAPEVVLVEERL